MRGFVIAAALLLLGAGCRPATPAKPVPVPPRCPDVCGAICSGKPEPAIPEGCAMPMCACDQPNPTK